MLNRIKNFCFYVEIENSSFFSIQAFLPGSFFTLFPKRPNMFQTGSKQTRTEFDLVLDLFQIRLEQNRAKSKDRFSMTCSHFRICLGPKSAIPEAKNSGSYQRWGLKGEDLGVNISCEKDDARH